MHATFSVIGTRLTEKVFLNLYLYSVSLKEGGGQCACIICGGRESIDLEEIRDNSEDLDQK